MADEVLQTKIIKSATSQFQKHGCKRITMDYLAADLHISKRTLYEIFAAKEDLLLACFKHLLELAEERRVFFEKENKTPITMVLYLFKGLAHFYKRYALMIEDTQRYYPEVYGQVFPHNEGEWSMKVKATLQEADRQGLLRSNADIESATAVMAHFLDKVSDTSTNAPTMATIGEAGYTFMRGLLSVEAIAQFDTQEQRIRDLINHAEIN